MTRQMKATKTVAEHIHLLRSRGMEVDATLAEQWLSNVSYYRMSAYWYPARALDSKDRPTDRFKQGTTFENATLLYEADRKLRTLVHDGMERIEIALRTRLGEQLCKQDPCSFTPTHPIFARLSTTSNGSTQRIDASRAPFLTMKP